MSLSDCDATNFELEQAVLESSLESFRNFEHGRKQASSSSAPTASARRGRQAQGYAHGVDQRDSGPWNVSFRVVAVLQLFLRWASCLNQQPKPLVLDRIL
jgi:hypothetical protein